MPEELAQRIGLAPTGSCMKGARIPERGLPKTSSWKISTEQIVSDHIDVYELVDHVVTQVAGKQDEIRQAIRELELYAVLEVVIHFSTDDNISTPAIGFSTSVIEFLNYVGATIDIDTYILPLDNGGTA